MLQSNQLTKKEIEDLLKKGAYGAVMEDDADSKDFCEEDIDHILQRRTQVVQIEAGIKGSTFAKASFSLSTNRNDIDIDDPEFWQKWAKKADVDLDIMQNKVIVLPCLISCKLYMQFYRKSCFELTYHNILLICIEWISEWIKSELIKL